MQYLFRVALALSSARFKNIVASSYLKISLETRMDIMMKSSRNPPWVCACAVLFCSQLKGLNLRGCLVNKQHCQCGYEREGGRARSRLIFCSCL